MKKIVAKVLIIDQEDKTLVLYRGVTHPDFPGHQDLPGGEVDNGETWEGAVAREISEETGLIVESKNLEKVFEKSYSSVVHVLYSVRLQESKPDVELSWEHSGHEWLTKDTLVGMPTPENIDRYFQDVLEFLKTSV